MDNKNRRHTSTTLRKGLAVASLGAILLTSACGQNGAAGTVNANEPQQGGTLRVLQSPDTLNCIDPFQTAWTATRALVRNFAQSLVDQDPDTGEIKPWLATDWTVNDKGTEYRFNLKQGVTFSNGEPFNADAVVKTFEEDLQTLKEKPGTVGGFYVQNLQSVTKDGDYSVTFHFDKPNGAFLANLATTTLAIIAPASTEQTPEQRCLADGLYGTGAFTVDKYDVNTKSILSKREGFSSPSPFDNSSGDAYLDRIEVTYVPDDSVEIGSFVSGQADVIWADSSEQIIQNEAKQIEAVGGKLLSRPLPGTAFDILPNVRHDGPLSDSAVRKAVSEGIDRATYAATVIRPGYEAPTSFLGSTTPSFEAQAKSVAYDVDDAKASLDEAGWITGDDGYRYKDGKKLTLHYVVTAKDTGSQLIQDDLKKIGVDLSIDVVTNSESAARRDSSDYDLYSITYTRADPSAIDVVLDVRYATFKSLTGNVVTDEQREVLEEYFDQAIQAVDSQKRSEIYAKLQQYIADQYLIIPIYERSQDVATSAKVHDIRFTAESFGDFTRTWIG